jgi:hypothetical protein
MGRKLSLCGCINAVWLIPLYLTAEESEETAHLTDGLDKISTSNLPSSSPRFLGTVLASYIIFFYSMYLLFKEYKWYTKWRHKFLAKPWSRNYTVYVSGIPKAYQTSFELAEYFRQCSSKEAVIEAHVAMDIPVLEGKIARRDCVVRSLEHAVALERKTGGTQTHRKVGFRRGMEKVESVSEFEAELRKLNRDIERSVGELMNTHDRFRSHLNRTTASSNVMANSQDWVGEDSDNNFADYQVLSLINSPQFKDSEDETDPLVCGFPEVPVDESVVPEHEIVFYGEDGGTPAEFEEVEPVFASMSREEGSVSEDGGGSGQIDAFPDEEKALSGVSSIRSMISSDAVLFGMDVVPEGETVVYGEDGGIPEFFKEDEPDIASMSREEGSISEDGGPNQEESIDTRPDAENSLSRVSSVISISSKADSESNMEYESQGIIDDAVLFGPDVSLNEPPSKPDFVRMPRRNSTGSSASSSTFLRNSVTKTSRVASHASQSIASGSRELGHSIASGSREIGHAMKKVVLKELNPDKLIQSAHDTGADTIKKAKAVGSSIVASASPFVPLLKHKGEGKPKTAGFVLFSSLYAATSAIQMVHHPKPYVMDVRLSIYITILLEHLRGRLSFLHSLLH